MEGLGRILHFELVPGVPFRKAQSVSHINPCCSESWLFSIETSVGPGRCVFLKGIYRHGTVGLNCPFLNGHWNAVRKAQTFSALNPGCFSILALKHLNHCWARCTLLHRSDLYIGKGWADFDFPKWSQECPLERYNIEGMGRLLLPLFVTDVPFTKTQSVSHINPCCSASWLCST